MSKNPNVEIPMRLITEMQHYVQRQHFINPVYLPALTESFLAKDFDFGEYLARMLALNILTEQLRTNFLTMLSCLAILVPFFFLLAADAFTWELEFIDLTISSSFIMNTLLFSSFILALALFIFVAWDLMHIGKALFPQILLDEDSIKSSEDYDEL